MSAPIFDPTTMCAGRTKSRGTPCTLAKGWRTDHAGSGNCRWHGGATPNGKKHAVREAATQALTRMGISIEIDPQDALMRLVWEGYGNVAYLRTKVQELDAVHGLDHLGDARPSVIVTMYGEWTDRLANICKLAISAGIAQKHLDLMERLADPIVVVVLASLDGLPAEEIDRRLGLAVAKLADFADFDILATGAAT
jgi:hypothetical protein